MRWIGFVVFLLVANAVAMGYLVAKSGDPTPRVLPDYYAKAIAWDTIAAERGASDALGWSVTAHLGDALEIELRDRDGAPLAGATIDASVRHRSRADHVLRIAPAESAPGRYAASVALAQPGLHVVELTAVRGAERFVTALVVERSP